MGKYITYSYVRSCLESLPSAAKMDDTYQHQFCLFLAELVKHGKIIPPHVKLNQDLFLPYVRLPSYEITNKKYIDNLYLGCENNHYGLTWFKVPSGLAWDLIDSLFVADVFKGQWESPSYKKGVSTRYR